MITLNSGISLSEIISKIINYGGETKSSQLIQILKSGGLTVSSSLTDWYRSLPAGLIPNYLLVELVNCYQNTSISCDALALAFEAALLTRNNALLNTPTVEIAWTGPHAPSTSGVRTTMAVLNEMLSSARTSIFLVGYSITTSAESTVLIVKKLSDAIKRGCEVKIAMHDDGFNRRNLMNAWPNETIGPTFLRWCGKLGDEMASLHAKVLIVDQKDLFITSANLTHHGLESNIEIGARIKGATAEQLSRHFSTLERAGIFAVVN